MTNNRNTPDDVKQLNRITIVFKDGEIRVYQPEDDWEDYRVFGRYFAVINGGGAWIGYYNLDEVRFIEVEHIDTEKKEDVEWLKQIDKDAGTEAGK